MADDRKGGRAPSPSLPSQPLPLSIVITCEHGGCDVPPAWASLFDGAQEVLASHRGWDIGAAECARALMAQAARHEPAGADVICEIATTTRLLVDLNRSPGHRKLFSEYTRGLDAAAREQLIEAFYLPYRQRIEAHIAARIAQGRHVLHVSAHSFTPQLGLDVRRADVALLFDPCRANEAAFAGAWREELRAGVPAGWRVRRNYPYRGTADGFTTALRRLHPGRRYTGLELEVNQRHLLEGPERDATLERVVRAFGRALERWAAADRLH